MDRSGTNKDIVNLKTLDNCETSEYDELERLKNLALGESDLKKRLGVNLGDKLAISHSVSLSGNPFLCMWQPMKSRLSNNKNKLNHNTTDVGISLQYLPTFYVVATTYKSSNNRNRHLLRLRLITFHGRVLSELKETENNYLTNEDKLNFIEQLTDDSLKLCRGICLLTKDGESDIMDRTLRLDSQTFTFLYLVERLDEEIIVRSRQCKYILDQNNKESLCKECLNLRIVNVGEKQRNVRKNRIQKRFESEKAIGNNNQGKKGVRTIEDCFFSTNHSKISLNYQSHGVDFSPRKDDQGSDYFHTTEGDNQLINKRTGSQSSLTSVEDKFKFEADGFNENVSSCAGFDFGNRGEKTLCEPSDDPHSIHEKQKTEAMSVVSKVSNEDLKSDDGSLVSRQDMNYGNGQTKAFQCQQCSYESYETSVLANRCSLFHAHASKSTKCKESSYETNRRENMNKHINSVHQKAPIKCSDCDYQSKKKSNMQKHVQSVHKKLKNLKCSTCSYSTSSKGNLAMHIRSVHEKIKPYLCELCSRSMSSRQHLKEHIRAVHEKKKPYLCELCSFKASTKSILKTHTKLVHNNKKCYKTIVTSAQLGKKKL